MVLSTGTSIATDLGHIAHMKVMEDTTTGHIVVEYCSTHNNHLTELAHLPIPVDVKHVIASKLNDGVGIEKILDDLREKLTNNTIYNLQTKPQSRSFASCFTSNCTKFNI